MLAYGMTALVWEDRDGVSVYRINGVTLPLYELLGIPNPAAALVGANLVRSSLYSDGVGRPETPDAADPPPDYRDTEPTRPAVATHPVAAPRPIPAPRPTVRLRFFFVSFLYLVFCLRFHSTCFLGGVMGHLAPRTTLAHMPHGCRHVHHSFSVMMMPHHQRHCLPPSGPRGQALAEWSSRPIYRRCRKPSRSMHTSRLAKGNIGWPWVMLFLFEGRIRTDGGTA